MRFFVNVFFQLGLLWTLAVLPGLSGDPVTFEPSGTLPYLSVEESLKTFELPEGCQLEAVVTEPEIAEPVVCAFDGNGRMYVAEMRTYMQDANATRRTDSEKQGLASRRYGW